MPKVRLEENRNLPSRWQIARGIYYYRVPPGHESFWGNKKRFPLGRTFDEALKTFCRVGSLQPTEGYGSPPYQLLSACGIVSVAVSRPFGGVYFLIDQGEIVYVGRSDNVLERISRHLVRYTHWHFIHCHGIEQERLEQLYIAFLRPRLNLYIGGKSPKSMTPERGCDTKPYFPKDNALSN